MGLLLRPVSVKYDVNVVLYIVQNLIHELLTFFVVWLIHSLHLCRTVTITIDFLTCHCVSATSTK